jgi:hypothetical protein
VAMRRKRTCICTTTSCRSSQTSASSAVWRSARLKCTANGRSEAESMARNTGSDGSVGKERCQPCAKKRRLWAQRVSAESRLQAARALTLQDRREARRRRCCGRGARRRRAPRGSR